MSLIEKQNTKEQTRINELEKKIQAEKRKLDKKVTRQKILLGSYLLYMIENNEINDLKSHVAENLEDFLQRKSDKKFMSDFIRSIGGNSTDEEGNNNKKIAHSTMEYNNH